MKVSIWRQFSSNHSANYVVVGKFQSIEQAELTAKNLKQIVLQIRETTPIPNITKNHESFSPTAIEKNIGLQYGFEWENGVDWAYWKATWSDIPVFVFRDTVWFKNPHSYTHQAPKQIIQLMEKMGAEYVAVDCELCDGIPSQADNTILLDIICNVNNEEKAKELFILFSTEFEEKVKEEHQGIWNEESLTGLPFRYYVATDKYKNPHVRLFEVEQDGKILRLLGLAIDLDMDQPLNRIIDYLEDKGCSDIEYLIKSEETLRQSLD